MRKKAKPVRTAESETLAEDRILRFPHLLGGRPQFRSLPAEKRIQHLVGGARNKKSEGPGRLLSFYPLTPGRQQPFEVRLTPFPQRTRNVELVRLEIRFPSGNIKRLDYR